MPGTNDRTSEFVQLFTANARWIFSYIFMLIPNRDDAEEVYQETNMTLWQKFGDFTPGTSFRKWAGQVARFKVLQYREKRRHAPLLFDDEFLEAVHGSAMELADHFDNMQWALDSCRDGLAPADRELLRRRYEPGATTQSVADQVGRSTRAVYRALERIHQGLYDCIQRKLAAEELR